MKKRVLFSACALAACFAACTNDDFQAENNNTVVNEAGEVIGADLVSSGMKMQISDGSADTRMTADGDWETGDRIGMGWYKFKNGIEDTQLESDWENENMWNSKVDNHIYANLLFTLQDDGLWSTQNDVYQGAYFAYWPFERMPMESKLKVVTPNGAPQTEASFGADVYQNSLYLSAQDFIAQGDVDENMVLDKKVVLSPMVNAIGVVATPGAEMANSDYLKSMVITQMQINVGGSDNMIITPSATLSPRYLPRTINNDGTDRTDEELRAELDKAAVAATSGNKSILADAAEKVNYLRTTIDADFTLAQAHTLRAFAFPFQKGANYTERQFPTVNITVNSPIGEWPLGTFAVNNTNSETLVTNLKTMFDDSQKGADFNMVQNILGEPGSRGVPQQPATMTANLLVKDFTPATTNIQSVPQWNDLVQLINELANAGKQFKDNKVTFRVTNKQGLTFTNEIQTPEKVQIVLETGDNKIYINGEVEWPKHLITDEKTANIEVNKGATLKVGIDRDEEVNLVANSIVNNGTIKAGAEASISTDDTTNGLDSKLDNSNGTVIVEFGAWVYPADGKDGVIAFEVSDNSEKTMGEINTLITLPTTVPQVNYAQVNTLILTNNVVLDLNAVAQPATEDDRYFEGSDAVMLSSLEDIDIWMRGATIVSKDLSAQTLVNNIVVEEGENTITDIRPQGDITIEGDKDGVLNITSEIPQLPYDDGTPWLMVDGKNIYNKGTLNVNETVTTTIFDNAVGTVNVENGETLYYTTQYIQGGHAHGTVEKTPTPADPTATLAANVQTTFSDYVAALRSQSTAVNSVQDVLDDLNNKGAALFSHKEDWNSSKFYFALNDYLKAKGQTALNESGTPTEVTISTIELFEALSGIDLTVE